MPINTTFLEHPKDRTVVYLPTIDSTSSELARLLKAGAKPGTVVIADTQSAGRGRLGRSWHSGDLGNLYISLAVKVNEPVEKMLPILPLVAGVATARTIRELCGVDAKLKWPNDLLVNDRKLAGILCEMPNYQKRPAVAMVGLGINLSTETFPDELVSIATSLKILGVQRPRQEIAAAWIKGLENTMKVLTPDNIKGVIEKWRSFAQPFGRKVRVGNVEGETVGIADDGCLIVKNSSGEEVSLIGGIVEYQGF